MEPIPESEFQSYIMAKLQEIQKDILTIKEQTKPKTPRPKKQKAKVHDARADYYDVDG